MISKAFITLRTFIKMNIPPFEFPHLQRLEFALKTAIGALNIIYNYHLYILFHPRKY